MILNNIGYVICESPYDNPDRKFELVTENFNNTGKSKAIVCLQTMNEVNRNHRFYAREDLEPQLTCARLVELLEAGFLRSEMGHPLDTSLARQSQIRQDLCCNKILKLWTEGDDIMAEVMATNNQYGQEFDADLKEGDKPAFSLRALGEIRQERGHMAVKNIRVITWDCVIYPSHPGAYTQRIVSENAESAVIEGTEISNDTKGEALLFPIKNEDVISYIKQESANIKFVQEYFDFVYQDIKINKAGTKVTLMENNGNILVVPLENHIHNEFMTYASDIVDRFYED